MKTVFFGSSQFCLPILDALQKELVLIITRPDKPVGRKQILTPSPIKLWAQKNAIPCLTPENLEKDGPNFSSIIQQIKSLTPDLAVVADYGLIIPQEIFSLPKFGTFNIHFSKLPDLRGASPIQAALLRGDTTAWITIFKLEATLDTGPILDQRRFPILPTDTAQSLYTRLFQEAAKYLPALLKSPATINQLLVPQDNTKATFCQKITRENGFIDWPDLQTSLYVTSHDRGIKHTSSAEKIYRTWQAMTPWPGLWTLHPPGPPKDGKAPGQPQRMKILKCHLKNGKLILDEVQFEGKKPILWSSSLAKLS